MKIILILSIVIIFGLIGYMYKTKLNNEYLFLKYIYGFHEYYVSNISLFKNNIIEIIDKYIIMQNIKNAKYNKLFLKNNNIYKFDKDFMQNYISNKTTLEMIYNYFCIIGTCEYEYEKEKNYEFKKLISRAIDSAENKIKTDGNLYFKLLLALGAVLAILLW